MEENLATKIVDKMYDNDWFSQWLGIERLMIEPGCCILRMKIRKEMLNGFGSTHGGITFSFADSALAFASNAHGRLSVALDCSISFPVAVKEGDVLTCEAKELSLTNKTGTYLIEVKNQKNENVAFFKGTVYRTSKEWFPSGTDNESLQIYGNTNSTDSESLRIYGNTNSADNESLRIYGNTNSADNESLRIYGNTNNTDADTKDSNKDAQKKLIYPELSYVIIGCAYDVFNQIGGGHKESVYQKALKESFLQKGLNIKEEIFYNVKYSEKTVGKNFFDFLIDEKIILEIKALSKFSKANYDQVLNYLHVSKIKLALLINFTSKQVDVKRVINFDLVNHEKDKN